MRRSLPEHPHLALAALIAVLLCVVPALPAFADDDKDCLEAEDGGDGTFFDCRKRLGSKFLFGLGIDNFAAGELGKVLNPDDANDNRERFVGGFDIQYRLWRKTNEDKKNTQALWVRVLTFHGVRSSEVDCTKPVTGEDTRPAICSLQTNAFDPSTLNAGETATFLLREASSLEGFGAVRWEFRSLGRDDTSGLDRPSGVLYLLGQLGFLSVDGTNDDVIDNHLFAIGAAATEGKLVNSFLEVGWGRTQLYGAKSNDRFKVRAFVNWTNYNKDKTGLANRFGAFAGISIDTDFGSGSDSVQSYIGVSVDLSDLSKIN